MENVNTFEDFVKQRIALNHLSINPDECLDVIEKYADIYPGISEIKRFFHFIHNKVGGILTDLDSKFAGSYHECAELFGTLVIRGKTNITFYEFVFHDDYTEWLHNRIAIYAELTDIDKIRLLNYVELSTMNMISDITTMCKYVLIAKDKTVSTFEKTGYGTDRDAQSFIKFLGTKFKEGYTFKPIA